MTRTNKTKDRIKIDRTRPKRILFLLILFVFAFIILIISFANTQIINGNKLKQKAVEQQLLKQKIVAKRGNILDRNGEVLAQSVDVDTVTVNPKLLKKSEGEINKEALANKFADIFGGKKQKYLEKLNSDKNVETLVSKVEKEKIKLLEDYLKQEKIVAGINIDEDIKRYYPYSTIASNILGFCGNDNLGLEGIEKKLNSILMGKAGHRVSQSDVFQNLTKDAPEQDIKPEDGKNVYLTIDIKLQTIVEKYLKEVVKENKARDGMAIVMNPKNGEILAMANEPTYDLNNPFIPLDMDKNKWEKLDSKTKANIRYSTWKNKTVTDLYDPGSTFKVITSAIGLEEGKTVPDKEGDFLCTGVQKVYDADIKCWRYYNPHGQQTLRTALSNSCNPAYIQLGQRIGIPTFYKYLRAFGLTEKTGVDLLGESTSIFHDEKKANPVNLATMSFGQRFQITPLQLITAISSIVNRGELVKPQVTLKIENPQTKAQELNEKKTVRKVVSEKTSKEMLSMLKTVVDKGTGRYAAVPGVSVGGKSGTSEPVYGDPNSEYIASFVGVAPIEDPQYVVLVIVRRPQGNTIEGGTIGGPVVGKILKDILSNANYVGEVELQNNKVLENVTVKNLKGLTVKEGKEALAAQGLELVADGVSNSNEQNIISQTPVAGTKLEKGSKVYIKTDEKQKENLVSVPNVKNKTLLEAKTMLKSAGLNVQVEGRTGKVFTQDHLPDTKLEKGSVVKITLKEKIKEGH